MRGLQISSTSHNQTPPPPPPPPPLRQDPPTSTTIPPQDDDPYTVFQATVDLIQSQQEDIHTSIEALSRSQTTITHQFAAFQQLLMNHLQPPQQPASTTTSPYDFSWQLGSSVAQSIAQIQPSTPATHPQISFGSIPPPPNSWSALTIAQTPPPLSGPGPSTSQPSPATPRPPPYSNHLSTPPRYYTSFSAPPHYATTPALAQQLPPPLSFATSFPAYTPTSRPPQQYNTPPDPHFFRPPKVVDLPRFTGEDVTGWLAMAERYIRSQHIPPQERVSTIASHFGPDASIWMTASAFEQRNPAANWDCFVAAFLEHFGSGNVTDFKAALSHIQQSSSVDEFITAFTKLSCRTPDWSDEQLLPIFLGGLKSELRHDVMALEPNTLSQAQRLARRYEARLLDFRAMRSHRTSSWSYSPKPPSGPHSSATQSINNTHMQPTNSTFQPATNNQSSQRPRQEATYRRLSTPEQRERRAKGLCFHCDEQWSAAHVCKKPILAILECPIAQENTVENNVDHDNIEELTDATDPPLPLNAITNSSVSEMMRFKGLVNGLPVNIFVDCGSAMNFLNPAIAKQLGSLRFPVQQPSVSPQPPENQLHHQAWRTTSPFAFRITNSPTPSFFCL
ncbi:uncharacterized protein LOC133726620 isoform X1 [Rosa rugosa]|uniref:uncharacterized protein LOC133726620 isoform X1 n=1 Tax=Rosa rugosa TaxID=74645 RepID=UPI002B40C6F4|nr:uncharacterized protein LOC133726620 isoform X1 [Rosa rugosa]